jgi:hypothetical protein
MQSDNAAQRPLEIGVTRYAVRRMQLGQMFVPVAIGAGILARRFPEVVSPYMVFALYAGVLTVILGSIKRFGKRKLHTDTAAIDLGDGLRVQRADVTSWAHHRGLARLYGTELSFGLRAQDEDANELMTQLTKLFGEAQDLQPRGSVRARRLALGVTFSGLLVALSVVIHGNLLVLFLGIAGTLVGIGAFAALRQRIVRVS